MTTPYTLPQDLLALRYAAQQRRAEAARLRRLANTPVERVRLDETEYGMSRLAARLGLMRHALYAALKAGKLNSRRAPGYNGEVLIQIDELFLALCRQWYIEVEVTSEHRLCKRSL